MTAKAVYASQTLNIYITREDLSPALLAGVITTGLRIADHDIPDTKIVVILDQPAINALRMVTDAERQVIARKRIANGETVYTLAANRKRKGPHHG